MDATGWPIPTQLIPLWQRAAEVQELLTSLSRADLSAVGCPGEPSERVLALAALGHAAGLDGELREPGHELLAELLRYGGGAVLHHQHGAVRMKNPKQERFYGLIAPGRYSHSRNGAKIVSVELMEGEAVESD